MKGVLSLSFVSWLPLKALGLQQFEPLFVRNHLKRYIRREKNRLSTMNRALVFTLIVTVVISSATAYYCDGLIGGTLIKWHEPETCNRFYACQHGTDHEWFCPPGEFFSQRNQQCESSCNPIDTSMWTRFCVGSQFVNRMVWITFFTDQWCAGLPDGTFIRVPPNEPFDCNKYYTCVGGVMHAQRCPAGFFFSQLKQMCGFDPTQCWLSGDEI